MFRNIEFFVIEAFTSFRRSSLMSMITVGIVAVSLVIFGFFLILIINTGNVISDISSKMDISAYVDGNLTKTAAAALRAQISSIPGVIKVVYVTKEKAWQEFIQRYEARFSLAEVMGDNPLPNTFNIQVIAADQVENVAKEVSNINKIDDVRYSGTYLENTKMLVDAVRIGGFILVFLLTMATLLIVVNTIRLTVLAREAEISIMRLVGATNSFISGPFIIEGILIGILGGVLAVLVLKFSYDIIAAKIKVALPFFPVVSNAVQLNFIYFMVVFLGVFLGMLGGYLSVTKLLKEK